MMINEDTLTLYYYNDGLSGDERRKVGKALQEDAVLGARYADLCRQLEQWKQIEEVVAPFESVQRWHDSIDRAATAERQRELKSASPVHFMSFFWGAAITAALAVGIGIGVHFSDSVTRGPETDTYVAADPISPNPQGRAVPVAFTRGLQLHLQESQSELSQLPVANDADRALLVMQIIQQNRLFEQTATINNSPDLARVLRAFEPILFRLASEEISPEDAAALRAQLAFELNVVLTKLSRDTSKEAETI